MKRAIGYVVFAALGLVMASASASYAATAPDQPVHVSVGSTKIFTATGVTVHEGESISVSASGVIHFGPGAIQRIGPAGLSAARCAAITSSEGSREPFPVPRLRCWSLIARIGTAPAFQVENGKTFRATSAGPLFLGINDNLLEDNAGTWSAVISFPPATSTSVSTVPARHAPPVATRSTSKSKVPEILAGLVALVLVVGGIAFLVLSAARRRKALREALNQTMVEPPKPAAVPTPVAVEPAGPEPAQPVDQVDPPESSVAAAAVERPHEHSVAPVEGEVVDVNIFEVELTDHSDLRVGYNYFPEGTELHWQIRQGSLFAHGDFATSGGGSIYHFVTVPLGVTLEPSPAGVDVEFRWSLGGVPFRYSVRRDPGA